MMNHEKNHKQNIKRWMKDDVSESALSDGVINEAIRLLKAVYDVKIYQDKPSVSNQGQCLDGYSALANFNGLADKIEKFLKENNL